MFRIMSSMLGGVISISTEIIPGFTKDMVVDKVLNIYKTCFQILHQSEKADVPSFQVADVMAEEKFGKY